MPDLKCTNFGISSPRSSTEGYSCAFPSWPNRPWLDGRMADPAKEIRHTVPSLEFLDSLRRRARPDSVFDDSDSDDDDDISPESIASNSSSKFSNYLLPNQRSNSLLSRAFSQLRDTKAL